MITALVASLGFLTRLIYICAQKVNDFTLKTYYMVIV